MEKPIKKVIKIDSDKPHIKELLNFIKRCRGQSNIKNNVLTNIVLSGKIPDDKIKTTEYNVNGIKWTVYDTPMYKYTFNDVHTYHCFFSKISGFTCRISDDINNKDPIQCDLGPEILDLEISVNGCPTVGGKNCRFCYKNNTNKPPVNMTFETFKTIVDKFPKCLYSIAFGITGVQTNPDFLEMMEYCRQNDIVPNYTLSGADLDEDMLRESCRLCGAVAVSCYQDNKELCYNTIKRFHDTKNSMHVNMHIVLSEDESQLKHIWEVLNDIKEGKVVGLHNIVFLRIKPVGRAASMNCQIHFDTYKKLMQFCFDNNIGFGFDSCSAKVAQKVLIDMGYGNLCPCCEPCEGTSFSFYCNVHGIATPCSFCEHIYEDKGIDLTKVENFIQTWNNNDMIKEFRDKSHNCTGSCCIYTLD